VLAVTSPLFWYTTRATGLMSLVLLTAAMVLGILTTTRVGGDGLPRFAVTELHRRLSLLAVVFVALHIVTTAVDSFVPIGWVPVLVPFTSAYQPLWVGLGTVAFDLLVAVTVSSLLRRHVSPGAWRAIHWLAYLSWPVAVAHGIGIGTDVAFAWAQVLVAVCIAAVLVALAWRIRAHPYRGGHRTAVPGPRTSRPARFPADGPAAAAPPTSGRRRVP
jgi:methionine sulfoxide reductase heme-binding subunit